MATKVVVVEDDQLIQRMYEKIFKFEKLDVYLASNGEEGIELIRKIKPTVVLLDIMMPKMNGIEVLEKLKLDPETKKIPVIMLTNLAGDNDAETALSMGAVKYIIKSEYDPKQVSDMVKEVIAGYTRNNIPSSS
jgi:CheY-like chemotaxis protein